MASTSTRDDGDLGLGVGCIINDPGVLNEAQGCVVGHCSAQTFDHQAIGVGEEMSVGHGLSFVAWSASLEVRSDLVSDAQLELLQDWTEIVGKPRR